MGDGRGEGIESKNVTVQSIYENDLRNPFCLYESVVDLDTLPEGQRKAIGRSISGDMLEKSNKLMSNFPL